MILAATHDGIHDLDTGMVELAGHDVGIVDARGGERWALADDGRTVLCARGGGWEQVATVDGDAATVLHAAADGEVYVGTVGAHVLRLDGDRLFGLGAFDEVPGRAEWYNPASPAGPDVWTLTSEGDAVFASVHVGGLWRTDDRGATWTNVLEPDVDIHQVVARGGLVAVAAQQGFALSRDGGDTWEWTTEGLHADYMQSVALVDGAAFVGVSSGPFAEDAAVYRASPPGAPFERRAGGLPAQFPPIGPHHLAADGDHLAAVPWGSAKVLVSHDAGASWSPVRHTLPPVHSLTAI